MSKTVRTIFVRHAEPSDDVRNRIYGRLDPELSALGLDHATRIARALADEPIAAAYTSPLRRAVSTAAPLASTLGLEPVAETDLREIDFGELEGLSIDEAADRYPLESQWMVAPEAVRFPGGESVSELRERAVRTARAVVERHPGQTVAVFSHAVVIRAILVDALSMPPNAMFRFEQSYGGISVVEWFEGHPYVRVVNAVSL